MKHWYFIIREIWHQVLEVYNVPDMSDTLYNIVQALSETNIDLSG